MGQFVLGRVLIATPVLIGVTLLSYLLVDLAPGDPVTALIDPATRAELGDEWVALQKEQLGLNKPAAIRYLLWLWAVARGNLGSSLVGGEGVADQVRDRLRPTALLMGTALLLEALVGVPLGVVAAVRQYGLLDYIAKPEVGAGPYKFVEYVPDQYVRFEANPTYYLGAPKIGQVFIQLAAPPTQLAQLEGGQLHLMPRMAPKDADRLKGNPALTIVPEPGVGVFQTAINTERFPDKRVRQAFMYAVDRKSLLDVVLLGQGRLVHSTIIGPDWARFDDLNPYPFDPARAEALLAEAGWDAARTVELTWSQGFQEIELAAPVFQQQLADVGVKVELVPLESAAYLKKVVEEPDFDLAWFGGGSYGLDPDVSSSYYLCANFTPAGGNTTHYCNEELDKLFAAGRGTPDTAKRAEIYHQVARILNEDVPPIYWWSNNLIWGMSSALQGVKPGPNQYIQWNIHEWSLAE